MRPTVIIGSIGVFVAAALEAAAGQDVVLVDRVRAGQPRVASPKPTKSQQSRSRKPKRSELRRALKGCRP